MLVARVRWQRRYVLSILHDFLSVWLYSTTYTALKTCSKSLNISYASFNMFSTNITSYRRPRPPRSMRPRAASTRMRQALRTNPRKTFQSPSLKPRRPRRPSLLPRIRLLTIRKRARRPTSTMKLLKMV